MKLLFSFTVVEPSMLTPRVVLLYRYAEPLPQLEVASRKAYLARGKQEKGASEPSVSVPCGSKAGSAFRDFGSQKGCLTS
jgi:hypothetical protein